MKNIIENWIEYEELPTKSGLKVIRTNDPNYGLSDDEIQARNEFISWYLKSDFAIIRIIPSQYKDDFFIAEFTASTDSAFNTHDFQDQLKPFNKYGYAMKKILERVKDLAILHSVISSLEGRKETYQRYQWLVETEFRSRLVNLLSRFRYTTSIEQRSSLKQRIGEINRRIIECKKIWEQYAPWGT